MIVEVASQRVTRLGGVLARRRPPTASPTRTAIVAANWRGCDMALVLVRTGPTTVYIGFLSTEFVESTTTSANRRGAIKTWPLS